MSLRLYTLCAVLVTISAAAGLLVGGFIATRSHDSSTGIVATGVVTAIDR